MTSLKRTSIAVGKVVFVAMGVPYGIAILVNSVSGWPQSDPAQSRVCKQLRPARVLSLNYAIWQQISLLKWLPLFVRGKSFYGDADPSLKNIPFGDNSLKMDIWLPKSKDDPQERPIIFFIYGGAWGSGYKELYAKFGQELANNLKAVVVVPDYRIFPKGTMQDMVNDISDAIYEFQNLSNIMTQFSVDNSKVVLIGHSAGAHLCTLTAIHLASNQLKPPQKESVSLKNINFQNDKIEEQDEIVKDHLIRNFAEEKADVEKATDLAPCVKGVIGIGGVYHIMDHYYHEAKRGVEDLSPMWRAAEGLQNFQKYSPTSIVPNMLIHGMNDNTVPVSSSSNFTKILSEAGVPATLKLLPGAGHAELVMDMMEPDRKWYSVMMTAVMEGTKLFLQEDSS